MVGSSFGRSVFFRRVLQVAKQLHRSLRAASPDWIFPAKFSPQQLQPRMPRERLSRARRAALLGVGRLPQQPGLWVRTSGDGSQRIYRVTAHNGELYASVGRFVPVAVPTARMPGYWDHLG